MLLRKVRALSRWVASRAVAPLLCGALVQPSIAAEGPLSDDSPAGWVQTTTGCEVWATHVHSGLVVTWSGDCTAGRASGLGIMDSRYLANLEHYEGYMRDGRPNGLGLMRFPDGRVLSGEFHAGIINGHVKYSSPSGLLYEGDWSDGGPEGQGEAMFADGSRYIGAWHAGQMNGVGTMTSASGTVYAGDFRDSRPNGHGTQTKPDGSRIDGNWEDGRLSGHAIYINLKGVHFEGEFSNGKRTGFGRFTFSTGDRYEGEWSNDLPNGWGTFSNKEGTFSGHWKNGCLTSPGSKIVLFVKESSCN